MLILCIWVSVPLFLWARPSLIQTLSVDPEGRILLQQSGHFGSRLQNIALTSCKDLRNAFVRCPVGFRHSKPDTELSWQALRLPPQPLQPLPLPWPLLHKEWLYPLFLLSPPHRFQAPLQPVALSEPSLCHLCMLAHHFRDWSPNWGFWGLANQHGCCHLSPGLLTVYFEMAVKMCCLTVWGIFLR